MLLTILSVCSKLFTVCVRRFLKYSRNEVFVFSNQLALLLNRVRVDVERRSCHVPKENSPSRTRNTNTTYARKVVRAVSEIISNTGQCFVGNNRSASITRRSLGSKDRTSGKDIDGFDTDLCELHEHSSASSDDACSHRKEHIGVFNGRIDTSIVTIDDDVIFIYNNNET